jgi:hypothetical protein
MSDYPALITFFRGWADTGQLTMDGFPSFVDTVKVRIERPPLLSHERPAIDQDFRDHPDEYAAYKSIEKARKDTGENGYPLVYWPAATEAEIRMLAARNITTVEGLAKLAGNRDLPGQLADLALRAERMIDLQKDFGKYEALIKERDGEIEELTAQVKELKVSLSAANSIVEKLKQRVV